MGGCSWGAGLGMPRRRGRGEDVAGRGCLHFCRWGKVPQRFFGEVGDWVGAPPHHFPNPAGSRAGAVTSRRLEVPGGGAGGGGRAGAL